MEPELPSLGSGRTSDWQDADPTKLNPLIDEQADSLFFTMLPLEVRKLIYVEFWRTSGLRQHISRPRDQQLTTSVTSVAHSRCLIDPEAPDIRFASFVVWKDTEWMTRLRSDWTIHWSCGDRRSEAGQGRHWSAFLPVLLTCKRLYLEGLPSIFDSVTFCLTDIMLARRFLTLPTVAPYIRHVEIALMLTSSLTDFYAAGRASVVVGRTRGAEAVVAAGVGGSDAPLSARRNVWESTCQALAAAPRLRSLRVWLDSRDLRPWHSSVAESRFCASLGGIRRPRARDFVLCLPTLPADEAGRAYPGGYLEGEVLETAPFRVERGERADKWQVYLAGRARATQEVPVPRRPDWV